MPSAKRSADSSDEGSPVPETIDVDFEFFSPKPIDFHGIKSLLKQLFTNDSILSSDKKENVQSSLTSMFSELAELIIEQSFLGSTVKVDEGGEDDPYSLMTVIPLLNALTSNPSLAEKSSRQTENDFAVKSLQTHILSKCKSTPKYEKLSALLLSSASKVGFLLNERLINMPVEIVVPMLRMLLQELKDAQLQYDYFLMISKIYNEVEPLDSSDDDEEIDIEDQESSPKKQKREEPQKKKKKAHNIDKDTTFYFQPEDEIFQKHADYFIDYKLVSESNKHSATVPEARNSFHDFGIDPSRRVLVISSKKLSLIYDELDKLYGVAAKQ